MSIMKLWDEVNEEWKSIPTLKGDPGPAGTQGPPGDGLIEGGVTGQVLKKKSDIDHDTEWGDAADPNAITSSDQSVKDIVTVTKEEFDTLVLNGELVEGTNYQITGDTVQATTSTPVGGTMVWMGKPDKIPVNYLLCEGQALNKSDYVSLYDKIGDTYGSTETTFNIPNIKGKVVVGFDSSQTEFNNVGKTGGAKTHTLTANELAKINGSFQARHALAGNVLDIYPVTNNVFNYVNEGGTTWASQIGTSGTASRGNSRIDMTFGNDQPHNNLQPYITGYYIIKVREEAYTEDLYNLDKQFSNFIGFTLWENPNPSANMITGTIILSSSEYDYFDVIWKRTTVQNYIYTSRVQKGSSIDLFQNGSSASVSSYVRNRLIEYVNVTQYDYNEAYLQYSNSNRTSEANGCIPLKIIGYKY